MYRGFQKVLKEILGDLGEWDVNYSSGIAHGEIRILKEILIEHVL